MVIRYWRSEYSRLFDLVSLILHDERELFGPILPIISVESISEAIEFVNSRFIPYFTA